MDNNDLSQTATHFLMGPALIQETMQAHADAQHRVSSERWAYPLLGFGHIDDDYYAEIWENGMDYNSNIWVLEGGIQDVPRAVLLAQFDDLSHILEREELWKAMLWHRRNTQWVQVGQGRFSDTVWPFLRPVDIEGTSPPVPHFRNVVLEHASQRPVAFWVNPDFCPPEVLDPCRSRKGYTIDW